MAQDGIESAQDRLDGGGGQNGGFSATGTIGDEQHPSRPTHGEVQHAILQDKVVGSLDVLPLLQEGVVDAGVGEATGQVGAGQRLHGHLGHGDGVAQPLHVLGEEVGIADVKGRHRSVKGRHGDGGDLGPDWKIRSVQRIIVSK